MILDLRLALGFLTRVPVKTPTLLAPGAMARAMWAFPLIGAFIGSVSGAIFLLAHKALPAWPAALLAIAASIILTGALHEDGIADCADGFGGGKNKEGKLAIMRDSRIGTYGALALILSVSLRAAALASFYNPVAALLIAHCLARTAMPVMMSLTSPATSTGVAASVGRPPRWGTLLAVVIALGATLFFYPVTAHRPLIAAFLSVALVAYLAKNQIGGYTGDVLGATEQVVEISVLLSILAIP